MASRQPVEHHLDNGQTRKNSATKGRNTAKAGCQKEPAVQYKPMTASGAEHREKKRKGGKTRSPTRMSREQRDKSQKNEQ